MWERDLCPGEKHLISERESGRIKTTIEASGLASRAALMSVI